MRPTAPPAAVPGQDPTDNIVAELTIDEYAKDPIMVTIDEMIRKALSESDAFEADHD